MLVKSSAAVHDKILVGKPPKCAAFERRTMTTIITVFPWYAGRLTIKSIAIASQIAMRGRIGCRSSHGTLGKYFVSFPILHEDIYAATSCCMPSQKRFDWDA